MNPKMSNHADWNNLDCDILARIFMTLSISDLIFGVSQVCHTWRFAARNPLLWHTLDLSALFNSMNIPAKPYAWSGDESTARFMRILKYALSLSGGNVTKLIFHFYICIKDEHFIYAAERCPKLKRLVLPFWTQITESGFRLAFQKLKGLESLAAPFPSSPKIWQFISANCNNFSELKVMYPLDVEFANSLSTYFPKLKVLSLRCSMVDKEALVLILTLLKDLEVLNISHCQLRKKVSLPDSCWIYWKPKASIIEKTSRLKKFLTCCEECGMCNYKFNGEGSMNWYKYVEFCRDDEVSSLAN